MSQVPEPISTLDLIYKRYQEDAKSEPRRKHLGGSEIGHSCGRKLWYSFHHVYKPEFEGRMYRLFETGKLEEDRVVADLTKAGCTITDRQRSVYVLGGFFGGSIDGLVLGLFESPKTIHLFECKTHSDSSFTKLRREGVRKANFQHYQQMQTYMGLNKLTRALYVAKNKNNDELYIERVHFEPDDFKEALQRAATIIKSKVLDPRISTSPNNYICRYCEFNRPCFSQSEPDKNCRTCEFSEPVLDGELFQRWRCSKHDQLIEPEVEPVGCEHYTMSETLKQNTVEYGR